MKYVKVLIHTTSPVEKVFFIFFIFSVSLEKLVRQSRPSPWRAAVVLKYAAVRDDSSYLCIFSLLLLRFFFGFFLHPWHFTCRCCQLPLSQKSASESHRQEKCSLPLHGHRRSSAARNQKQQLLAQNTPVWSSLCRFIENPTNCQTGFNVKHRVAFSLSSLFLPQALTNCFLRAVSRKPDLAPLLIC